MLRMKNPLLTEAGIARHIAKGYGQGAGNAYKPWLEIRHVPSLGKSSRPLGWKTDRIHHFLSQLELRYFYMLEWSDSVIDIQEQFPLLPIGETREIAHMMGVNHPRAPKTEALMVMTTDFLITTKEGTFARCIKPAKELESPRTLEKLEIERAYWERKHTDWKIVTEHEIDIQLAKNVEWIHTKRELKNLAPLDEADIETIQRALATELGRSQPLGKTCREVDKATGYEVGASLSVFRHLLATKTWAVDMSQEINPSKPAEVTINEYPHKHNYRVA
jgi:hypothetical protein